MWCRPPSRNGLIWSTSFACLLVPLAAQTRHSGSWIKNCRRSHTQDLSYPLPGADVLVVLAFVVTLRGITELSFGSFFKPFVPAQEHSPLL